MTTQIDFYSQALETAQEYQIDIKIPEESTTEEEKGQWSHLPTINYPLYCKNIPIPEQEKKRREILANYSIPEEEPEPLNKCEKFCEKLTETCKKINDLITKCCFSCCKVYRRCLEYIACIPCNEDEDGNLIRILMRPGLYYMRYN
jgi:hypothetical protein